MLPLNLEKCKVMHLGNNNPKSQYSINGHVLETTRSHCDLGLTVTADLSWSQHTLNVTRRAGRALYLIESTFRGCSPATASLLYKSYVRPILEFAGPAWFPTFHRDMELLERLQRRATRLPYGLDRNRPSYSERLNIMGITEFQRRRSRGDLIVTFRALNGFFGVDLSSLFVLNPHSHLRGHHLKLYREQFRTRARQQFLSNRVFEEWNRLPVEIIASQSVNSFKNNYSDCG